METFVAPGEFSRIIAPFWFSCQIVQKNYLFKITEGHLGTSELWVPFRNYRSPTSIGVKS